MSQRILIVDDEAHLRLSLGALLEQAGFQVMTASNADEALAAMEQSQPDLVLLDVILPGEKDGFSVCEEIRAQERWQGVRILVITARGRAVEREKALALGADGFIVKPFSVKAVIDQAQTLLAKVA